MADQVFNIALGRSVELYNRVDLNDPANAVIIIAAFNVGASDASLKDVDTLAAIEALASTAEATNTGYARKVLTDADIVAFAPDDANDRVDLDIPDQTWTAVSAGTNWTDLVVAYDSDSTGGTDANIVPMTLHDFVVSPNGGDVTAQIAATGFFRAL
jgi:hypothetical protein